MATRRSESAKGSGRSSTALSTVKIAVFAPMPRASVSSTMTVNPGALASDRKT